MIIDLPDTTTNAVNKKLDELREDVGAVTMGRVLTLIIAPDSETVLEESIEAALGASHEHPSRIIVTMRGDPYADKARLDAQLRAGGDAGGAEVVVLRLSGPLSGHANSVVIPFLLPDIPVVAWWPDIAPSVPAQDPLGKLAIRRITDATNGVEPLSAIKSRLAGYTAGDTDLAWSRITYWRALLTSAIDLPPHEPIESALVSGLSEEPALDVLAINTYNGWYTPDRLRDLPASEWRVPVDKPLIFSEFGADARAGFHDPANKQKFSEDYQADYYRATLAMAAQLPTVRGMSPWILKDFRSPRRQNPDFQQGWNRKGLISETGERKEAFGVLSDFYHARSVSASTADRERVEPASARRAHPVMVRQR